MAIHTVNHPLVKHKLGILRHKDTPVNKFREISNELCLLLAYEATKDLPVETVTTDGWAGPMQIERIKGKKITVVPILRAGLGMLDGFFNIIPSAKVSTVGMFRNEETLSPVQYYVKLANDIEQRTAVIIDPMLATGGTLIATIDLLKKAGCKHIMGLFLVAAPEGLKRVEATHPDVDIYVASIDSHLNEHGYIIPGLGDAGDKLFGTK